ncbi:hypothetical protein DINM_006182 [Dirofilaria immitis]|nr:hypothetical protein [Dirofilaria immitis]
MEMTNNDMEISMAMISDQCQTFATNISGNTTLDEEKNISNNIITSSTTIAISGSSSSCCNLSQTGSNDNADDEPSHSRKTNQKTKQMLLEDYLKILQATDSIMEPNIEATIKGFLRNGGHPEVVITSLTDSYRGLAKYCELLGDCSLLEKRFVSAIVDKNFEAAHDVDKWLPELLNHSTWRNLIYTLIEQNPRSKFLMKAIRMISDAGFQHEITNVHPAAQQEKNEAAAACTHLAQILRREAHKRKYQDTYDIHIALDGGYSDCDNDVKRTIYTMLSKKCLNQADIIRLYERYSSSEPPTVEFIQDPFFIDMLIDALFAYEGSKVQSNHRSKYTFLLSYASCSTSHDRNSEGESDEVKETQCIMEQILDSIRSEREFLKDIRLLLNGIAFSSIASGLLHYLKGFLLSDEILSELEVVHFVLLDEMATEHSGLHIRLFEVLCELYDRQSKLLQPAEMIIEKQRSVIDRFVHLLSVGFALPVVEKINKMFQEGQIDVSLARYFAVDVLDIIEPPYSEQFSGNIFTNRLKSGNL